MCKYRNENHCTQNDGICPWAFWCGKDSVWKERDSSIKYCKLLQEVQIPKGYCKVEFERRGYLYISYNDEIIKVQNPFDDVPNFVKVKKNKTSYKLTQ